MDLPASEVLRGYRIDGAWLDEVFQAFDEGKTHACGVPLTPGVMAHLLLVEYPVPGIVPSALPDVATDQSPLSSDGRVFGFMVA